MPRKLNRNACASTKEVAEEKEIPKLSTILFRNFFVLDKQRE